MARKKLSERQRAAIRKRFGDDELIGVGLAAAIVGVAVHIFSVTLEHLADEVDDGITLILIGEIERL